MAISFDTSSISSVANPATSVTWSHTCTGDNRILFVAVGVPTTDKATGVTYNSVAMTKIESFQIGDNRGCYLYYLIAPATEANDVVVSGTSDAWIGAATSFTGASQTGVPDASTTKRLNDATDTITTTLTTTVDNCWTVIVGRSNSNFFTGGTGTTIRQTSAGIAMADSNASIATAGSTSLILDTENDSIKGTVMASFAPAEELATDNSIMFGMNF